MGVKGLTAFVASSKKKYLKKFRLHDCFVIIDGNSLAHVLYSKFIDKAYDAFGGDYDQYAQCVKEFFNLLNMCGVNAIVVFDGRYERRKLKTVMKRMNDKIAAFKKVKPSARGSSTVFPLFMRIVLKQVLKELDVPFVQCDLEADQEIASVARKYNCPVLSNDSDFYIFGVDYIPLPSIKFEAKPLITKTAQTSETFYIHCKIYECDTLSKRFDGFDMTLLPLLATLLGNDYVSRTTFEEFYLSLKNRGNIGNVNQDRIAQVIEWLRKETFQSAVEKIIGQVKETKKKYVAKKIITSVDAYTNINLTIESYLPLSLKNRMLVNTSHRIKKVDFNFLNVAEDMYPKSKEHLKLNEYELVESGSFSHSKDYETNDKLSDLLKDIDANHSFVTIDYPEWLKESGRQGLIEACIFSILNLGCYFSEPQMEHQFLIPAHLTSVPVIKVICKLLVGNHAEEILLYTRCDNSDTQKNIQKIFLPLSEMKNVTDLNYIPNLTLNERKLLLLECLGITSSSVIDSFPDDWKLYICAIIFWIRNTTVPLVTDYHLLSLCLCMVWLSVIGCKVGYFATKTNFLRKYSRLLNETKFSNKEIGGKMFKSHSVDRLVSSVHLKDCVAVYLKFHELCELNKNILCNESLFCFRDIHAFAQFQSCLFHISLLNSILDFPLKEPIISLLYSGTFIYNVCSNLKSFKDVDKFLGELLDYSPKIINLVRNMYSEVIKESPVQQKQIKKTSDKNKIAGKHVASNKKDVSGGYRGKNKNNFFF